MKHSQVAIIALAATLLGAGSAYAAGPTTSAEYYPFQEIMSMKMIDKDKDGMVSKKEFMDMMGMAWEMNTKKMGAKGDKVTPDQLKEIMMYLKAGG